MDLIGRGAERAALHATLTAARDRRASSLFLVGVAGTGKTTLLADTLAAAPDFQVLHTAGSEAEAGIAFAGLLTALRHHLGTLDVLDDHPRQALRGALSLGPPTMADRLAIGVALLQLLGHLAEDSPVLVVLDDLQWLDAPSRDALLFALRRLDNDRVAAIGALRPDPTIDLHRFPVLTVDGLPTADAARLLTDRHGLAPGVATALATRCEGNPLALLEVAARLTEPQRAGLDALDDRLPVGPATIELYRPSIRALGEHERFALLIASLTERAERAMIRRACVAEGIEGVSWDEAEAARLVVLAPGTVEFAHPLVRSAVVELADPVQRRRAHRALAAALPDGPERVHHRADATDEPDEAVAGALAEVALDLLMRGSPTAAARAADRAAQLSPAEHAPARHVLAAQAASLAGLDHTAHTRAALASGVPHAVAEALVIDASAAAWTGDLPRIGELTGQPLADLEQHDRIAAAVVCGFAAGSAWNELELDTAGGFAARSWALADEQIDLPHRFGLMPALAIGVHGAYVGRPEAAIVDGVRERVLRDGVVELAAPLAIALCMLDRHDDALSFCRQVYAQATERGNLMAAAWMQAAAGMIRLRTGLLPAAERWLEQGREVALAIDAPFVVAHVSAELSLLHAMRGSTAASDACSTLAADHAARYGLTTVGTTAALGRALNRIVQGDIEAGAAVLLAARPVGAGHTDQLPIVYELVEALVRLGRLAEAEAFRPQLLAIAAHPTLGHRAPVERSLGLLATDAAIAIAHFEAALAATGRTPRPIDHARTQLAYGERLRRAGSRGAAREHLEGALAGFEATGCAPWAERARTELRAAGATAPAPRRAPRTSLTAQEDAVARAVAIGLTNREVASRLFLSTKTVEMHLTRAYRKLGVRSRTELANHFSAGTEPTPD